MAVWDVVKTVQLDLSMVGQDNLLKIVRSLNKDEVSEVISKLDKAIKENKTADEAIQLALGIAKFVLSSGMLAAL